MKTFFWLLAFLGVLYANTEFPDIPSAAKYLNSLPVSYIPSGIEKKEIGYPFYEQLAEGFFQRIRLSVFADQMESYDMCFRRDGFSVMPRWDYEVYVWRMIEKETDNQWLDAQKMAIACIEPTIKAMKKIGR